MEIVASAEKKKNVESLALNTILAVTVNMEKFVFHNIHVGLVGAMQQNLISKNLTNQPNHEHTDTYTEN